MRTYIHHSFTSLWLLFEHDNTQSHAVFFTFRLFTKLVLEAPIITESALEVIRRYCEDEVNGRLKTQLLTTVLSTEVLLTQLRVLAFVSVPRVPGHDDPEGAHRQTAVKAVPVPARAAGSQLTRKGKGGKYFSSMFCQRAAPSISACVAGIF